MRIINTFWGTYYSYDTWPRAFIVSLHLIPTSVQVNMFIFILWLIKKKSRSQRSHPIVAAWESLLGPEDLRPEPFPPLQTFLWV